MAENNQGELDEISVVREFRTTADGKEYNFRKQIKDD